MGGGAGRKKNTYQYVTGTLSHGRSYTSGSQVTVKAMNPASTFAGVVCVADFFWMRKAEEEVFVFVFVFVFISGRESGRRRGVTVPPSPPPPSPTDCSTSKNRNQVDLSESSALFSALDHPFCDFAYLQRFSGGICKEWSRRGSLPLPTFPLSRLANKRGY